MDKKPLKRMFDRRKEMGADDPGGPIDLEHIPSSGTVAGTPAHYQDVMAYMTQPAVQMGPEGRRAEALMPAGPRDVKDEVVIEQPRRFSPLLSLFGGLK